MSGIVRPSARACGLAAALSALAACATPPTQLVVVVDTDLALGSEVDEIAVRVTGTSGMAETERATLGAGDSASLPLTLGVVASGDSLGPIEVLATASLDGVMVVAREHRVTLVRGETRVLELHLTRACAAREACPSGQTCGENGCTSIDVEGTELPSWGGEAPGLGRDGGTPLDAGSSDAASSDAASSDAAMPACDGAAACDDGDPCTEDACESGACVHTPADGTPCDDGVFCNGLDTCDDGACTQHAGSVCVGATVCDEAGDRCTGCGGDSDCPAASTGAWGACTYETGCDESGTQSRIVRTFACVSGACVPSDSTETQACTRSTEGDTCAAQSCGEWSACAGFATTCGETGTRSRSCSVGECRSGSCTAVPATETEPCTRDTDGIACGSATASCSAWSVCAGREVCDTTGSQSRSCRPEVCIAGSCGLGDPVASSRSCSLPDVAGSPCGARTCGSWGPCLGLGCALTGTRTRSCQDYACSGTGACEAVPVTETGSCARVTDGNPCDDGLTCTLDDACINGLCRGLSVCGRDCTCTSSGCRSDGGGTRCLIEAE